MWGLETLLHRLEVSNVAPAQKVDTGVIAAMCLGQLGSWLEVGVETLSPSFLTNTAFT